jgi:hypothetical protein
MELYLLQTHSQQHIQVFVVQHGTTWLWRMDFSVSAKLKISPDALVFRGFFFANDIYAR